MKVRAFSALLLVGANSIVISGWSAGSQGTNSPLPTVELRGQVVCLSEEMRRRHGADVPQKHEHDYGFKTDAGPCYSLLHGPLAEALLTDTNLHTKVLLVKGRIFPQTQILEVTGRLHSLSGGKTNELYYYCDICAIDTSFPGPCLCCREP